MAQTESILVAPLPKNLVKYATPIAAILLTTFFILLDFPYHHLTNRVAAVAGDALGVEIDAAESGLTLGLDGIGFGFEEIRVETATGEVYDLTLARLGGGWSTSWFSFTPTFFFEIDSHYGSARGKFRMGEDARWSGSITEAALGELKFLEPLLPIKITGTLSAKGDVKMLGGVPEGPLVFSLKDGVIGHPAMPIEIPYKTLEGQLKFGGEQWLIVETFELQGPILSANLSGTIESAAADGDRALDLDVSFKDVAPAMRNMVQMLGVSVNRDGTSSLHIGGTLDNPSMR